MDDAADQEVAHERRDLDKEYVRKSELESIITRTVREALAVYKHDCVLHLEPEQIKQVGNLFSAIKEIGKNDLSVGIEQIRENHKLWVSYRAVTGKIGTTIITTIILALLGFIGTSFLAGIVEKIKLVVKS